MAQVDPIVTEDKLVQHRLDHLEKLGEGWLEAQRRMEVLTLSQAAIEKSVASIAESLERNAAAMARLHERIDTVLTEKAREEGREEGRAEVRAQAVEEGRRIGHAEGVEQSRMRTWKVVAFTVTATTGFGLLVVAALNFALN